MEKGQIPIHAEFFCAGPKNYTSTARNKAAKAPTSRQLRLFKSLLIQEMTVKDVARVCGCNNGPDLVVNARHKFCIEIPCTMFSGLDRDGNAVWFGRYKFTDTDRRIVLDLLGENGGND